MKALVLEGIKQIRVSDVKIPVCGADETLLAVTGTENAAYLPYS